jgi:hypothetical protein
MCLTAWYIMISSCHTAWHRRKKTHISYGKSTQQGNLQ